MRAMPVSTTALAAASVPHVDPIPPGFPEEAVESIGKTPALAGLLG